MNLCAKKYQEIDDLKGIIQQRKNKDKVVLQIEEFLKKCDINNAHGRVNIGKPLYKESLEILENNPAVSREDVAIFKNDARLISLYPGHGPNASRARILFLNDIIINFSAIKSQL